MIVTIFIATNGALTNLTAPPNWFIEFMTSISPCRFSCESFFIAITKQIPTKYYPNGQGGIIEISQKELLKQNGFDLGTETCLTNLIIWIFIFIALSLIVINFKYRQL